MKNRRRKPSPGCTHDGQDWEWLSVSLPRLKPSCVPLGVERQRPLWPDLKASINRGGWAAPDDLGSCWSGNTQGRSRGSPAEPIYAGAPCAMEQGVQGRLWWCWVSTVGPERRKDSGGATWFFPCTAALTFCLLLGFLFHLPPLHFPPVKGRTHAYASSKKTTVFRSWLLASS